MRLSMNLRRVTPAAAQSAHSPARQRKGEQRARHGRREAPRGSAASDRARQPGGGLIG